MLCTHLREGDKPSTDLEAEHLRHGEDTLNYSANFTSGPSAWTYQATSNSFADIGDIDVASKNNLLF